MKRLVVALFLSLALVTGCSTSVTGVASYAGESLPAEPPATTPSPTTTTPPPTDDIPTKAEVRAAVEQFLDDSGLPAADSQELVDCITDDIYVTMSTAGLNTLVADGVDGQVSNADYDAMEEAIATCVDSS